MKPQNKNDRKRLEILSGVGCIPCMIDGWLREPPTIQHKTDCGRREKDEHQRTYPSCAWHHQGYAVPGLTVHEMTQRYGPSFAVSKRDFEAWYGLEEDLIGMANGICHEYEQAWAEGRYLTDADLARMARDLAPCRESSGTY